MIAANGKKGTDDEKSKKEDARKKKTRVVLWRIKEEQKKTNVGVGRERRGNATSNAKKYKCYAFGLSLTSVEFNKLKLSLHSNCITFECF